jgi:glycosyltransferase involved in cell wall biosynthesis
MIHHVTYSSWRVPSPLWQLEPPLIWGPVGGVATYPFRLFTKMSLRSSGFELLRTASNALAANSPALKRCVSHARAIVASNHETFAKLAALRGHSSGLHLLSPSFFTPRQIAKLTCDPQTKEHAGPLRMFAGGSLIGPKGVIFALEAVRIALDQGVPCHFLVASGGPEVSFLKKQAVRLQLGQAVDFHGGFYGADYIEKLKQSHVFLLPSFRENAPSTILEAMLAGCVPVVVDASAQGEIVKSDYGFKVPQGSPSEISHGLAQALVALHKQPELRVRMGRCAAKFVQDRFTEDQYDRGMRVIYESLRTDGRSPHATRSPERIW